MGDVSVVQQQVVLNFSIEKYLFHQVGVKEVWRACVLILWVCEQHQMFQHYRCTEKHTTSLIQKFLTANILFLGDFLAANFSTSGLLEVRQVHGSFTEPRFRVGSKTASAP
jgi:hypothetical protein